MEIWEALEVLVVYIGFMVAITIISLVILALIQIVFYKIFKFNFMKWLYKKAMNS